ncbi:hypothetical protein [Ilumatobacter sp.]|uniref:hypothetical protein n=1 Tax=Ilumatobacter sp. TaxID=1967498 RepID=UPI003C4BC4D1
MKRTLGLIITAAFLVGCAGSDSDSYGPSGTGTNPVEPDTAPVDTETVATAEPPTTSDVSTITEASPVDADGTRDDPVPLGVAADIGGGWAMTVNSVELDGTESVAAENPFNDAAPEGTRYVVVNITAVYNGDEPSDTTGVSIGGVGEGTNVVSDISSAQNFAVPPAPAYQSFSEVFQGGETSGNVVLEVPVEDIDTLVLIGQAFFSFDEDDRKFFATR